MSAFLIIFVYKNIGMGIYLIPTIDMYKGLDRSEEFYYGVSISLR